MADLQAQHATGNAPGALNQMRDLYHSVIPEVAKAAGLPDDTDIMASVKAQTGRLANENPFCTFAADQNGLDLSDVVTPIGTQQMAHRMSQTSTKGVFIDYGQMRTAMHSMGKFQNVYGKVDDFWSTTSSTPTSSRWPSSRSLRPAHRRSRVHPGHVPLRRTDDEGTSRSLRPRWASLAPTRSTTPPPLSCTRSLARTPSRRRSRTQRANDPRPRTRPGTGPDPVRPEERYGALRDPSCARTASGHKLAGSIDPERHDLAVQAILKPGPHHFRCHFNTGLQHRPTADRARQAAPIVSDKYGPLPLRPPRTTTTSPRASGALTPSLTPGSSTPS